MNVRDGLYTVVMLLLGLTAASCQSADEQETAGSNSAELGSQARQIISELRPRVRIEGRPDSAYSLQERMEHYQVPGVSIAVVDENRIVWAEGFGTREIGSGQAVDTTTRFLAGSISKPVFATGVLRLVEQGQVFLDRDINRYLESWTLPETKYTKERSVTLRHLLSHSAGLTVHGFPGYDRDAPRPTVPEILDGEEPANTDAVRSDTFPGAHFDYSGGGITVAQLAVTDVTNDSFPDLMRRLVLEPAGMTHSTFRNPPPPSYRQHVASGHEEPDKPVEGDFHVYPEMAAAGLWTTPSDLARWAMSLSQSYRGEDGLLSSEMARSMLTSQIELPEDEVSELRPDAWGLGVGIAETGDSLRFTHGGRDHGFVATFSMWPEQERGLFVMTNGVSYSLLGEIQRAYTAVYGGSLSPRVEKEVVSNDSVVLDGLEGHYQLSFDGFTQELTVEREGSVLWGTGAIAAGGARQRLYPQGSGVFFSRGSGTEWRFIRPAGAPKAEAQTLRIRSPGADTALVAERIEADSSGVP